MSVASAALEPPRLRLWGSTAIAVLLAHLAIVGVLLWHVHPYAPPPVVPSGIDVDLTTLPAAAPSSAATLPRGALPQPSIRAPRPITPARPLQPLEPVQPVTAAELTSPEHAQAAEPLATNASSQAASAAAAAASDLTTLTPAQGTLAEAVPGATQLWQAQINAQLARHLRYPFEARDRHQQDTVQLQFTLNRSGAVLHASVDSTHHYRALEKEVLSMLRSAGPLLPPPAELRGELIIINLPVQFHLTESCHVPVAPGAAPSGALATLNQLRAYRQRLITYLAAAHGYLDCLDSTVASAASTPSGFEAGPATPQSRAGHSQPSSLSDLAA